MPRPRVRAIVASVFALAFALVLVGCGSGAGATPTGAAPSAAPGETEVPASEPAETLAPVGDGSCSVEVTGAVTADWETPQDASSVIVSYWLSDAERAEIGQEGETFLVNCDGGDAGYLNLSLAPGTTAEQFPQGPATYEIVTGDASTGEVAPGQVSASLTLADGDLWAVAAPGTVEVTRLDGSSLTATFEFPAGRWDPEGTASPRPEVTVRGSFDFDCTTGGCT